MTASNEIDARVTKVLVQALGVEEDDVTPSASLQRDLGAESIDFLDIAFRMEREFMIKIPRGELFSELVLLGATEIVQDGQVTDLGLETIRAQLPFADWSDLEGDRQLNQINDLYTVGLVSSYIAWKLGVSGASRGDSSAQALHHSPKDLMLSVISTGI